MKNYPMEFQLKRNAHFFCIIPYPINTYVNLSLYTNISGKIKTDDIGKVIVVEKPAVNFKQPFIRTKNIVER